MGPPQSWILPPTEHPSTPAVCSLFTSTNWHQFYNTHFFFFLFVCLFFWWHFSLKLRLVPEMQIIARHHNIRSYSLRSLLLVTSLNWSLGLYEGKGNKRSCRFRGPWKHWIFPCWRGGFSYDTLKSDRNLYPIVIS